MFFYIALFITALFAADVTVHVDCGTNNCANGYTINGQVNPKIHCNVGDTLRFDVNAPGQPLYIKTDPNIGAGSLWSASNNGQELGTVVLQCTPQAKVESILYYQSSASVAPTGEICIGDACGAPICTGSVCWGARPASSSPKDLSAFIQSLAPDFAYFIRKTAYVTAFAWDASWTQVNGLYAVQLSFVRSDLQQTVVSQIVSAVADNVGVSASTFGMVVTYDGELAGESTGYLYIGDPSSAEDELGGYIDVLFFGGLNDEPQCNIHNQCSKYRCYAFENLIGEYSGDSHVREGQCLENMAPEWGRVVININAERTGGTYKMGCDDLCLFCPHEGTFEGDECKCQKADNTQYNCFSVKFASSSLLAPSMIMLILSSIMSIFF